MSNSKTHKTKWMAVAGALVLLALIGALGIPGAQPVRTASIKRGTMQTYIEEKARTSVPLLHQVSMPMPGRIISVDVAAGDLVQRGQVIARLEAADWQDALKEANALVTAMQHAVTAMDGRLASGQAALILSKWILDAKNALYRQNQTSELEEKQARHDHEIAQADKQSDLAFKAAAEAMLAVARLMPIYVRRQLARTALTSPTDGQVMRRHVSSACFLTAGAPLVDIADMQTLEITADILTEQSTRITNNAPVTIFGESIGSAPIRGFVRLVEPLAFTKTSSLGVEQQRVPVRIRFDEESYTGWRQKARALGLGYRVNIRIITAEHKETLMIPRTALFRGDRQEWQAYVVRNGRARLAEVRLGLLNDEAAEVMSGLEEGDQVILTPDSSIDDGKRVKPASG